MATGTVKFCNTNKGFGFIKPEEGSKDVFVHISAVERAGMSTLNEGRKLSFEVVTERGLKQPDLERAVRRAADAASKQNKFSDLKHILSKD